jgi:hypothetical protein
VRHSTFAKALKSVDLDLGYVDGINLGTRDFSAFVAD